MKRFMVLLCILLFSMMTMAGPVDVGVGYAGQSDFASVDVVAMATGGEVADDDVMCNNSANDPMKMASCKNGYKITDNYSVGDASGADKSFAGLLNAKATPNGKYDLRFMLPMTALHRTLLYRSRFLDEVGSPPGYALTT